MSEITGREEARIHRFGETYVALSQFDGGYRRTDGGYLLTLSGTDTSYQLHLNQDGVEQLHELFAKFARLPQVEAEQW